MSQISQFAIAVMTILFLLLDQDRLSFQMGLQCYFLKDKDCKIVANSFEINTKIFLLVMSSHAVYNVAPQK